MKIITRNTTHPTRTVSGQRELAITALAGGERRFMVIRQLDRDFYVLDGMNKESIRVKGWADGVRLIRNA